MFCMTGSFLLLFYYTGLGAKATENIIRKDGKREYLGLRSGLWTLIHSLSYRGSRNRV